MGVSHYPECHVLVIDGVNSDSYALSLVVLTNSPSFLFPAATVSKAHQIDVGGVCNGTEWLVLSSGGCAKPGTDIADLSKQRFEDYVSWLGQDVCRTAKRKIAK